LAIFKKQAAMRREPDFYGEEELILVYLARRLRDALAVEKIFEASGLDYALETGPYQSGLLFRSSKVGVYFYVRPQDAAQALTSLSKHGRKSK
jgi:hypothetical protein